MNVDKLDSISFLMFEKSNINEAQTSMLKSWGHDFAEHVANVCSDKSKSEVRRMIEQRGIRINNRVVDDKYARIGWEPELKLWVLVQVT